MGTADGSVARELRGGRCRSLAAGWVALALLAWALVAGARASPPAPCFRQVQDELPPPRTEYMGRRIAPTMHWSGAEWLSRETRESEEHTSRMIAALGLRPGDVACDLGCGNGYITLPMAKLIGVEGKVLAVDIQHEMLERLAARAKADDVRNIRLVLGKPADPKLAPASCDLVLMVDVYHELGYPEQVLEAVRAALKPSGRLVLVEFRAEDPDVPIKPEHKMSRAQVQRELSANGFRFQRGFEELPWQHMLFYLRDDAPVEPPLDGGDGR